jgi:hypothetical protein
VRSPNDLCLLMAYALHFFDHNLFPFSDYFLFQHASFSTCHLSLARRVFNLFHTNFYLIHIVTSNCMCNTYPSTVFFLYFSSFSNFLSFFFIFLLYTLCTIVFSYVVTIESYWVDYPYTVSVDFHSPFLESLCLLNPTTAQHLHL